MKVKASTVLEYLDELPEDRRAVVAAVRDLVRKNLPEGYQETLSYGVISYVVPLERLPKTYNGQPLAYISLAAQKHHYALYLMCVYASEKLKRELEEGFDKQGKKLDMGKGCVRFKNLEDLPLDVIAKIVGRVTMDEYVKIYEDSRTKRPK